MLESWTSSRHVDWLIRGSEVVLTVWSQMLFKTLDCNENKKKERKPSATKTDRTTNVKTQSHNPLPTFDNSVWFHNSKCPVRPWIKPSSSEESVVWQCSVWQRRGHSSLLPHLWSLTLRWLFPCPRGRTSMGMKGQGVIRVPLASSLALEPLGTPDP